MSTTVPVPPRNPDDCPPWLYETLTRLRRATVDLDRGISAIVRGEVPDGSGQPLTFDNSKFLYKPGIIGGQLAYGDTKAGSGAWGLQEGLILSSTAHSTKGYIYFGSARTSGYDESNGSIGLSTPTSPFVLDGTGSTTFPSAHLDIAASTTAIRVLEPDNVRFTKSCSGNSGDTVITGIFNTSFGSNPVAGMWVSGTGIPSGTYIKKVIGGGRCWLSSALTQDLSSVTVTFSPEWDVYFASSAVSGEQGRDVVFEMHGGLAFAPHLMRDRPLRMYGDIHPTTFRKTAATGARTVANCSGNTTTNVVTTTGTFASVVVGDAVGDNGTGGVGDDLFYVEQILSTTQIKLTSRPFANFAAITLSFRSTDQVIFLEQGQLSAGTAIGGNIQIGGPNHGGLQRLHLQVARTWFRREADITGAIVSDAQVGININPSDFALNNRPLMVSTVGGATTALVSLVGAPVLALEVVGTPSGTTPTMAVGARVWGIDPNGALIWYTGAAGAEVAQVNIRQDSTGIDVSGLGIVDVPANVTTALFKRSASWATLDAGASLTTRLVLGDNGKAILGGRVGAALTRFGITSAFVTVSNGTNLTIPLGDGLVHIDLTTTTATVGLVIKAAQAGQTADLMQFRDSTGAVIAAHTVDGGFAGNTSLVSYEDDLVIYEDETVYFY